MYERQSKLILDYLSEIGAGFSKIIIKFNSRNENYFCLTTPKNQVGKNNKLNERCGNRN